MESASRGWLGEQQQAVGFDGRLWVADDDAAAEGVLAEVRGRARAMAAGVVLGLPASAAGLRVAGELRHGGATTAVLGCDTAELAIAAARAGAVWVAPPARDSAAVARDWIRTMAAVLRTFSYTTGVLVTSLRTADAVVEAAIAGAGAAAIPESAAGLLRPIIPRGP